MHYHYLDVATDENGVELYDESGEPIVLSERDDTSDITDRVTFGDATPSNTYVKVVAEDAEFRYDVPVYYRGEELTDAFGEKATVEVYIGVKGDADLNNVVDGSDATIVLKYYAAVGTSPSYVDRDTIQLSTVNPKVTGPASVYDQFAAFLSDVDSRITDNWAAKKNDRNIDGSDATLVLRYYALAGGGRETGKALWDEILGTVGQ